MIKLALPGLLMVEAEFLAFEILTLAASWLDTTHLAAQSVVSTITAITFQIPFPISIAASTRVANLIGATLTDAAKTSAKVVSACQVPTASHCLLMREELTKVAVICCFRCCWHVQHHPSPLTSQVHPTTLYLRSRCHRTSRTCLASVRCLPAL